MNFRLLLWYSEWTDLPDYQVLTKFLQSVKEFDSIWLFSSLFWPLLKWVSSNTHTNSSAQTLCSKDYSLNVKPLKPINVRNTREKPGNYFKTNCNRHRWSLRRFCHLGGKALSEGSHILVQKLGKNGTCN